MAGTFYMYAPRTVALLKRANALGKLPLALSYDPAAMECFVVFRAESDPSDPKAIRFASEATLRAKLEEIIVKLGGTLPSRGGNQPKSEANRLQAITIRVNAAQREAVETYGRPWVRSLIDEALRSAS